jgi:hypothetical protein
MKAFAAFCCYRDLSPRERSLRRVADLLYGDRGATKGRRKSVPGAIQRWASRFAWLERAAAWDEERERLAREAEVEAIKAMRERHAKEAVALQERALARLRALDPAELSPRDVLAFIVEATKLERISRGQPETIAEQRDTWVEAVIEAWQARKRQAGAPGSPSTLERQDPGIAWDE